MFTYAELISLQSAMAHKIAKSKRHLNEVPHIDKKVHGFLVGCLNDDIRTLNKIKQLIDKF